MENYTLGTDEAVLFEEYVILPDKESYHLILTNQNLVFVPLSRRKLKKGKVSVSSFSVSEIKTYNDVPQVAQKMDSITVYLITGEVSFHFDSLFKAKRFVNRITELITGKGVAERGANVVKNALGLVDDTLGINTVNTITGVLENGIGGSLLKGVGLFGKKEGKPDTAEAITAIANAASAVVRTTDGNQSKIETPVSASKTSFDQQMDMLKKLKELMDMGVISQEEFERKKSEILNNDLQ